MNIIARDTKFQFFFFLVGWLVAFGLTALMSHFNGLEALKAVLIK